MTYQSMDCPQCVRKHLANAISYAKEVLSGHGAGGDPDHRPDLLGELGNAEHHLAESSGDGGRVLGRILSLRRQLEETGGVPGPGIVAELRILWTEVSADPPLGGSVPSHLPPRAALREMPDPPGLEASEDQARGRFVLPDELVSRGVVDVLILPGNTDGELEGIRGMIANLEEVGAVYENELPEETTDYILVWPPRTGIIRSMRAGLDYPVHQIGRDGKVRMDVKPQIVEAAAWRAVPDLDALLGEGLLRWDTNVAPFADLTGKMTRICCGVRRKLSAGAYFVHWAPENWELLRKGMNDRMEWTG